MEKNARVSLGSRISPKDLSAARLGFEAKTNWAMQSENKVKLRDSRFMNESNPFKVFRGSEEGSVILFSPQLFKSASTQRT